MVLVPVLRAGKPYHSKVVILLRDYVTRTSRTREIFLKRCISRARFNAYRSLLRAAWPDRSFDGWAWRAHDRAQESRQLSFAIGVRTYLYDLAQSVGQESTGPLPGQRHLDMA